MAMWGGFVALAYMLAIVAVVIYLIVLATQFVKAHRRCAEALELIARKMASDSRE